MKTIGILGGMGPEATADLYLEIVRIFQQKYGAKYDADFPPFFIFSLPIPEVVESLENEEELITQLQKGVRKLEEAGADFIVVACNTIYSYFKQMQKIVNIPILNLPLETLQFAQEKGYSKVGLLSTQLTVKKRLFESKDDSVDIITPNLEEQAKITTVIMNVLSGVKPDQDKLILKKVIQRMEGQGAQAVILGCTELPLLLKEPDSSLDLLNTTKILAQAAVRECRQNIYKPKIFRGT